MLWGDSIEACAVWQESLRKERRTLALHLYGKS